MALPPPPESMAGGRLDCKPSHRRTAGRAIGGVHQAEEGSWEGGEAAAIPGALPSSSHHRWRDRRDPARGGVGEAVEGMDPVGGTGSDEGGGAMALGAATDDRRHPVERERERERRDLRKEERLDRKRRKKGVRQGTALRGNGDRGQWRRFSAMVPCSADLTPEPRCSGGAPPCRL